VDKRFLEECLRNGLSLEAIGKAVGRHPSTVGYWLEKHGLEAVGRAKHAPKGEVDIERLRGLVESGASIREIASELERGYTTIRRLLRRLGLETDRMARRATSRAARAANVQQAYLRCPTHAPTTFYARPEGGFRCGRCRSEAVSKRRRKMKLQLVREAGGCCAICGFSEHPAALQFHHLDPAAKSFHLSVGGQTRSIAKMRAEARKCVLLCATCHALVEAGVRAAPTAKVKASASRGVTPG
jgi:transposase